MKNIKFLFLAVATLLAGAFTSCQKDWNPGPVDSDLSVYLPTDVDVAAFPKENNAETGDDVHVAKFPVYRQNPGPEMTVEFRARHIIDYMWNIGDGMPHSEAFVLADSVTFAEGETVAYFTITMDDALVGKLSVGEMFEAEIMVKDAKHHGNYGLSRKVIKFGIPESWGSANIYFDPESDETFTNEGYLFEDFFTWLYGSAAGNVAPVVIEQSESRPGYYRLVNPFSEENIVTFLGGVPSDITVAAGDSYLEIDATDPEKVWIPFQPVGFSISGFGEIWIGWVSSEMGKLEDGVITFPESAMGLFLDGNSSAGYYANTSGLFKVVLPGVSLTDYSMSVAYVGSQTAEDHTTTNAIIEFNVGADVDKFRFVAVDGKQDAYHNKLVGTTIKSELNEEITKLIDVDFSTYEPAEDETMAEAKPEEARWFVSFDEPGVHTIFAVPYNKEGEPVMEEIASTYFYYRPIDADGDVPVLAEPTGVLASWTAAGGNQNYAVYYDPSYVLALGIQLDDAAYVSSMNGYFGKKADIDALIEKGETFESLLASEDVIDYRTTSTWVESLQKGGLLQEFTNLEPDTEYSVIISMSSIYGKTVYYRYDGQTAKYNGAINIGVYEFVDGDSKMQIKVAPIWDHNTYGQMYLLSFVGDKIVPEDENEEPFELQFYTYFASKFNALVAYGDAVGYGSVLFGRGLDEYVDGTEKEGDPVKYWGYYNSSREDFMYSNESLVLHYDNDGFITSLGTYFKKFYYWHEKVATGEKDENGEDITKEVYNEVTLTSFAPKSTTVTLVEDHMPAPDAPEDNTGEENTPEDNTGEENTPEQSVKRASVGVYTGSFERELKANVNAAATATVSMK